MSDQEPVQETPEEIAARTAPMWRDRVRPAGATRDALLGLASNLQKYFSSDPEALAMGYHWADNMKDTRIVIRTIYDSNPEFFPQIVVGTGGANFKFLGFGAYEEEFEDRGEMYTQRGGRSEGTITVRVEAEQPGTRVDLTDLLAFYMIDHWEDLVGGGLITNGQLSWVFSERPYHGDPSRMLQISTFTLPFGYDWYIGKRLGGIRIDGVLVDADPILPSQNADEYYNA